METVAKWDQIRATILSLHNETYAEILELKARLGKLTMPQLVDVKHCLRLARATLKDITKEINQTEEMISNAFAMYCMLEDVGTIHGTLATGWAEMQMMVTPPRRGDEHYELYLSNFGIPAEAAPYTDINYPKLIEYATQLASQGKSLKGVAPEKQNPKYTLKTRGLKDGKDNQTAD